MTSTAEPASSLVLVVLEGEIDEPAMLAGLEHAGSLAPPGEGYDVLSDHRGLVRAVTPDEIVRVLEHIRRSNSPFLGHRWAVVTTAAASYGMMRLMSVHAERLPIEVRIFDSVEAARRWLASRTPPPSRDAGP